MSLVSRGAIGLVALAVVACRPTVDVGKEPAPIASASVHDASAGGATSGLEHDAAATRPADDPAVAAFFAGTAELPPDIEDRLLAGLASCGMKEEAPDPDCPGVKAWKRAESERMRADKEGSKAVAQKHIAAVSPATRCAAASVLGAPWGSDATSALLAAAEKEQDPNVLSCIVRRGHASWLLYPTPAVRSFLTKMTEHPSELVRRHALARLLFRDGIAKSFPDGFLAVAKRLDVDPSMAIRKELCQELYETEDERAIPLLAKYLEAKDTPDELYAACFGGLVEAWARNPRHEKPSRKAYELTLKLLAAKPRTRTRPTNDGLGMASLATAKTDPSDDRDKAWRKAMSPWYDPKKVLATLEDLALDAAAGDEVRHSAVYAMRDLGAPRATFVRMVQACKMQGASCTETIAHASMVEGAEGK